MPFWPIAAIALTPADAETLPTNGMSQPTSEGTKAKFRSEQFTDGVQFVYDYSGAAGKNSRDVNRFGDNCSVWLKGSAVELLTSCDLTEAFWNVM